MVLRWTWSAAKSLPLVASRTVTTGLRKPLRFKVHRAPRLSAVASVPYALAQCNVAMGSGPELS